MNHWNCFNHLKNFPTLKPSKKISCEISSNLFFSSSKISSLVSVLQDFLWFHWKILAHFANILSPENCRFSLVCSIKISVRLFYFLRMQKRSFWEELEIVLKGEEKSSFLLIFIWYIELKKSWQYNAPTNDCFSITISKFNIEIFRQENSSIFVLFLSLATLFYFNILFFIKNQYKSLFHYQSLSFWTIFFPLLFSYFKTSFF